MPLARALIVLAVPLESWRVPDGQAYVLFPNGLFARRVASGVQRGPLTRMLIGKSTARIDVTELATARASAESIVNRILLRADQMVELDPAAFDAADSSRTRLRSLQSQANLYRRDTGIDGLYLGFPFIVFDDGRPNVKARVAPVLLWPINVRAEIGARGRISLGFDSMREEVRLNSAFEGLLGPAETERWREVAVDLLGRSSLSVKPVIDAFATLVPVGADGVIFATKKGVA